MNKLYFIDSENVGNEWLFLLNEADENDVLHFFYTKNSEMIRIPCFELKKIAKFTVGFQLHKCEHGKNALDFQLSTELGAQIVQNPCSEFIIVSNDNGFDAIVLYWTENGKNIKIQKTRTEEKAKPKKKKKTKKASVTIQQENNEKNNEKFIALPVGGIPESIKELFYIVDSRQKFKNILSLIYGHEHEKIYKSFADENAFRNYLKKHKKMTKTEKVTAYCKSLISLINPKNNISDTKIKQMTTIVKKYISNENEMQKMLTEKFGETGNEYYGIIKEHLKFIEELIIEKDSKKTNMDLCA